MGKKVFVVNFPTGTAKLLKKTCKAVNVQLKPKCWNRYLLSSTVSSKLLDALHNSADSLGTFDAVVIRTGSNRQSLQSLLSLLLSRASNPKGPQVYLVHNDREHVGVPGLLDRVNGMCVGSTLTLCHLRTTWKTIPVAGDRNRTLSMVRLGWTSQCDELPALPQSENFLAALGHRQVRLYQSKKSNKALMADTADCGQEDVCTISPQMQSLAQSLGLGKKWHVFPGLFAGGGLDVMTAYLLETIRERISELPVVSKFQRRKNKEGAFQILDYCCGSGTIAKAMHVMTREAVESVQATVLDNDMLAIAASQKNLGCADVADVQLEREHGDFVYRVSNGFSCFTESESPGPSSSSFHLIVSNPPVHDGAEDSFGVVRDLIATHPRSCANMGNCGL